MTTRRQVQTPGATPTPEVEVEQVQTPEITPEPQANPQQVEQITDPEAESTQPSVEQQLAAALESIAALEQPKQVESVASIGEVNQQAKPRVAVLTKDGWSTKEAE